MDFVNIQVRGGDIEYNENAKNEKEKENYSKSNLHNRFVRL